MEGAEDTQFLGFKIAPGQKFALGDLAPFTDADHVSHAPHITSVALGPNPKAGRHTVFAQGSGEKAVLGTLEMGRCEQFQTDLLARDITFSHSGKSDIYIAGYNSFSQHVIQGFDDDEYEEDDEDEDEEDDAPQAVPLQQQLMPSKKAVAKQKALLDPQIDGDEDDSEDEDDDEDDDDDDEQEGSGMAVAKQLARGPNLKQSLTADPLNGKDFSDMEEDDDEEDDEDADDDDDDDDDDEDEDEDEVDEDDVAGLAAAIAAGSSDDDDDDDDVLDDDDEDDEEDGESQDDTAAEAAAGDDLVQALQAANKKRAAPTVAAQPAKKAKATAAKSSVIPASAPAAAATNTQPSATSTSAPSGLTGPAAAQWLSGLKRFLTQSGGEADMSKLGSVKKPEGIAKNTKLKAFLLQHAKVFAVDGNTVKLKK